MTASLGHRRQVVLGCVLSPHSLYFVVNTMINAFIVVLGCICFWATLSSSFILSTQSRKQTYPYYYDVQLFAKNNNRREVLNSLPLILTPILPANAQEMADNVRKY